MALLVLGGTGTVGSAVARELLSRGHDVTILTRDPSKPAPKGAKTIQGDLNEPATVRSVFRGMDGVFLINAVGKTECHEGLMALNGARAAKVGKVVYLSVHLLDRAPHLPHFGSKLSVETALKASGLRHTILRPNNYYQNDAWFKEAIAQHGVYPQPLGSAGVSRVDVRDIAEAAAIALTSKVADGETLDLVGPDSWTGPATAREWSKALGREIRYGGDDLDAWENASLAYLPAWMVYDFRLMYRFFQSEGFNATPEAIDRLTKVLGHPPREYEAFVEETAKGW